MKRSALFAMLLGILLMFGPARANDFYVIAGGGSVGTKITSLPYTINKPGFYYLGNNLDGEGGITVSSYDVTLDLMGFAISGPGTGTGTGISLSWDPWAPTNVEIRNGTIKDFYRGISAYNVANRCHRVINVRFCGNTTGISLPGEGHLIKGCTFYGNSTGISCSGSLLIHNIFQTNGTNISGSGNTLVENRL